MRKWVRRSQDTTCGALVFIGEVRTVAWVPEGLGHGHGRRATRSAETRSVRLDASAAVG